MLIGGENYEVVSGLSTLHAKVGKFEIDFIKDKERLVIRRDGAIILEIDSFFVKTISGISVRNEGMKFIIKSVDFDLTYEFLRLFRFKTDYGWIVVELSGGN